MASRYPTPAFNQISSLTALVVLSYGLIRMITLPSVETEFALLGLFIKIEFRTQSIMLILVAALAASGVDWLIRNHPYYKGNIVIMEHWVLPALAAVAIGVIVLQIPESPQLWLGLFVGALLLVGVLWAEFIVSFQRDPRYGLVTVALNGLAFLLLSGSFFAISALQLRVVFAIPIVLLLTSAVIWRLFRMGFPGERVWTWGLMISIITAQIAVALHYWPISPLRSSLLLCFISYLIYQFIVSHLNGELNRSFVIENLFIGGIALLIIASVF